MEALKKWLLLIGCILTFLGTTDILSLTIGWGGILPKIPPERVGVLRGRDNVILDQGVVCLVLGMLIAFPILMRESDKAAEVGRKLRDALYPFSVPPTTVKIPPEAKKPLVARLKKVCKIGGVVIFYLYLQLVVALSGHIVFLAIKRSSGVLCFMGVFFFFVGALSSAGFIWLVSKPPKPKTPKAAIMEALPRSSN